MLISKIYAAWGPGYTNPPEHICVSSDANVMRQVDVNKITQGLSERLPWVTIQIVRRPDYNKYTFTISVKQES